MVILLMDDITDEEIKELRLMKQIKQAEIEKESTWRALYDMYSQTSQYKNYINAQQKINALKRQLGDLKK